MTLPVLHQLSVLPAASGQAIDLSEINDPNTDLKQYFKNSLDAEISTLPISDESIRNYDAQTNIGQKFADYGNSMPSKTLSTNDKDILEKESEQIIVDERGRVQLPIWSVAHSEASTSIHLQMAREENYSSLNFQIENKNSADYIKYIDSKTVVSDDINELNHAYVNGNAIIQKTAENNSDMKRIANEQLISSKALATGTAGNSSHNLDVNAKIELNNLQLINSLNIPQSGATVNQLSNSISTSPLSFMNPGWDQALGNRINYLINNNISSSNINIDPPELGALNIRVYIENGVASVHFTPLHIDVHDAIESALPTLREMFDQGQVQLAEISLTHPDSPDRNQPERYLTRDEIQESELVTKTNNGQSKENKTTNKHSGLIDYYI